jgi:hypothetical protein
MVNRYVKLLPQPGEDDAAARLNDYLGRSQLSDSPMRGCARADNKYNRCEDPVPMNLIDELLRAASEPLFDTDAAPEGVPPGVGELLAARNGFFAFASALHVRPSGGVVGDVVDWNREDGWRKAYGQLADGLFFFAEDAFGNQFALDRDGRVVAFDAETGGLEPLAESIIDWVKVLLDDWRHLTGYPLAHDWQDANRPLTQGERLLPRTPFVIGGEYSVENLTAAVDHEAMAYRGEIATQIAHLPEGTEIVLRPY